jgi:hypothetical protein
MNPLKKSPKISHNFVCESCNYKCSKLSEYNKHLSTNKHKILQNPTHLNNQKAYTCSCGKKYKHSSTLYAHKKKNNCQENIVLLTNLIDDKLTINTNDGHQQLVEYLMKENSEFKQLMIDQNKHMLELAKNAGNHNNNTINTSNNFNLQFFLNETCKDAMNIMEFVDQLQVSVKDLEETGRLGYSEGISKIFINGLKQINISDRPIHCADSKREIVYIKDKNQWNKEDDNKSLLTNAIKHVAHKNMRQIKEWTKVNPEYNDSSSKQNDRYLKIVSNSMNGSTEEETIKNYNKIIKNITKETVIEK